MSVHKIDCCHCQYKRNKEVSRILTGNSVQDDQQTVVKTTADWERNRQSIKRISVSCVATKGVQQWCAITKALLSWSLSKRLFSIWSKEITDEAGTSSILKSGKSRLDATEVSDQTPSQVIGRQVRLELNEVLRDEILTADSEGRTRTTAAAHGAMVTRMTRCWRVLLMVRPLVKGVQTNLDKCQTYIR